MDRRSFFSTGAGAAAAGAALFTHPWLERLAAAPPELPPDSLHRSDPESYWRELRRQFLISPDEVYLNNGTCGSSPAPVIQAILDGYHATEPMADAHPEDYPIWGYGIVVRKVALPKPLETPNQAVKLFADAITSRTRILFFSHITTATGVVLPAKELCTLARDKGLLSAVDGAHVVGMMRLDVHDLGCDFYTSSPHKWLQSPKGSGFLYIRSGMEGRLWNTIVSSSWDDPKGGAYRFQQIGTSNVPNLWGLRASIDFANRIGMDKIEARHRAQNQWLLGEMEKRGARNVTGIAPELRCGIVAVDVPPIQRMALENWMWTTHKIRIRGSEPSRLRLSTPYYLQQSDLDRFLSAFDDYRRRAA